MNRPARKTRRRSAPTQGRIVGDIKKRIISGNWPVGERLPNRAELIDRYNTSNVTIQKVMDTLLAEGFVETRGALGTFVSTSPPHLTRYGLVFPESRTHYFGPPSLFWQALSEVARDFPVSESCRLESYFDALRGVDGEDYKRLVDDIEHHRLAGLVFASPPHLLRNTPVLDAPGLSRVLIAPLDDFGGLTTVYPDYADFVARALERFQAAGSRRLAVLGFLPAAPDIQARFERELADRGMTTRPQWQQYPSTFVPEAARRAAHLLLSNPADRPDGLFIFDDNLVESATLGIADAGVAVPADLRVVAHANFPLPVKSTVPVERLGFDIGQLLHRCIDLLRRQNEGAAVAPHTWLPASRQAARNPHREALLGNLPAATPPPKTISRPAQATGVISLS